MRINSSGNVGLGTTNPGEKLHVAGGSIRLSDAGNTDGVRFEWQSGTTHISNGGSSGNIIKLDTGSQIQFWTGVSWVSGNALRWTIDAVGNLSTGTFAAGNKFMSLAAGGGIIYIGQSGTSPIGHLSFWNGNGEVGSISTNGYNTSYVTSSDERMKRDFVVRTDSDVLRRTTIYDFKFLDGTSGRGVKAQEAYDVHPLAITVGNDSRDEAGHLLKPWATDYSKYVPDLIVGWQQHDSQVAVLERRIAALEARLAALER